MNRETLQATIGRGWPYVVIALLTLLWAGSEELSSNNRLSGSGAKAAAGGVSVASDSQQFLAHAASSSAVTTPRPRSVRLEEAPPREVSILTLNLQTGGIRGPGVEARTQVVADLIERHQPDAVALQEVAQSKTFYRNRARVLAEMTGYHFRWERIDKFPYLYAEGVALLSRWPIESAQATSLPHTDVGGVVERRVLKGRIAHPRTAFSVFATHFNVNASPEVQREQAEALWSFVRRERGSEPAFVGADLNAPPGANGTQFLRGAHAIGQTRGDFVDAWMATRGDKAGPTAPSDSPKRRIDYVFEASSASRPTPQSCRRVLKDPVDGTRASDHFGVLCRFELLR